jgi:hypothetical protein
MTYHLPWLYVATLFVSRSGSSQENKGSIHYNSITTNKDTNCNESPEGDLEKPLATPPFSHRVASDTIASIAHSAGLGR